MKVVNDTGVHKDARHGWYRSADIQITDTRRLHVFVMRTSNGQIVMSCHEMELSEQGYWTWNVFGAFSADVFRQRFARATQEVVSRVWATYFPKVMEIAETRRAALTEHEKDKANAAT